MAEHSKLKALRTIVEAELEDKGVQEDNFYNDLQSSGVMLESIMHFLLKIVQTELIVLLQIIDFWYTKNVSGRRMVGLRWWINFDEEGEEEWKFECRVNEDMVNPVASKIFWFTMYGTEVAWLILLFFNVFKLSISNVTVCAMGAVVVGVNLYAFHKCSNAQKKRVGELANRLGADVTKQLFNGSIVSAM
ncbi:Golgi apparatus membrane protein TVP23 homolog B-like [Hippocampus zosterae]|uniref:Golgi apparatus membrane protein TVP23 homolog B-like n=1 Tax=Hippocampus zosterae TaxID=109293 RepID=UPI00223CE755|nr:Golgi apparatus membrane protein TVP23 homolog B-like [Hippocampus zosterae]